MGCGDGEDGVREVEMGRGRAEMRGDEKDGVAGGEMEMTGWRGERLGCGDGKDGVGG